ncbi:TAP-like protein-domain-containing protein [Mycena rosella]|uniref:TAP-like protein-domain-containing protein n=1 Tax=Mycena rosella TaxID=1033263 RepID=A0AAD7CTL6_MYCRO|nr:TAP-like protein-domain-containing protein [Mycena rosella]
MVAPLTRGACILFFALVFLIFNASSYSRTDIVPSQELIWTDCYSDKQCARLKVPLDYAHPDAASAAIAMIRIHSIVPHNSTDYRGPVLINPGGPGNSGVDMIRSRGPQISTIVGPEFDIIGFDPRGISRSTPRVAFFETRSEREIWSSKVNGKAMSMNASADALPRAWAQAIINGELAGERDDGSLRFINTDHTARDMLRIVQAHGLDKIQYWGFSYGSILGATFASMFPENVGRLVIDGVADSENYFATEWSNNLIDADKVWSAFIDGCVAAGQEGCPFFSPTTAEISAKVDKIYASLRERPIPVRTNASFGLVDYSMVRHVIFKSLYSPYAKFPGLAQALADLSTGNATALFKMSEKPSFECGCDESQYRFESVAEGEDAVLCNDGQRIPQVYEDIVTHYRKMSETSTWADVWEPIRMACLAWPEFPKTHFRGPFIANTSFPLLLVGTTADPVTPLWSAHKMSQGFNGSVVLTQDSAGHCSISGPSICTQKHIRRYFLEGTLPEPGTVCPVIGPLFPTDDFHAAADAQTVLSLSAADRTLLEAVRELATTFDIRFPVVQNVANTTNLLLIPMLLKSGSHSSCNRSTWLNQVSAVRADVTFLLPEVKRSRQWFCI